MSTPKVKPAPDKMFREMQVRIEESDLLRLRDLDASDEGDNRIPIAISSEHPVSRRDWWTNEVYHEVLVHTKDAVDLSYAKDGLAFLDSHDAWSQMGLVEDVTVDNDGILRGYVRFSQREEAQALRQDMLDGIRKKISVGYRQLETETVESKDNNTPTQVRVTRWLPMEASSVAIPADYTVGVGRSAGDAPDHPEVVNALRVLGRHFPHNAPAPQAKEQPVSDKDMTAQNGADPAAIRISATADERKRLADIDAMCTEHAIDPKVRGELINSDITVGDASRKVLDIVRARMANPTPSGPLVRLTDKEAKQYSFARAILSQDRDSRVDAGFEREIEQELERKLPAEYTRRGGVLIPTQIRAGLDSGTATKGAELKFTQPGEFIDLLRNRMKLRALGARVLAGLTGPVSMPRQTAAASGEWIGENSGTDAADSNVLLALVTLAIKTYQASTSFSRQLLVSALSASVDAEQMVREDLALVHALAFDLAGISGSGSSNQPRGILNTTGIGSEAGGTNGAAPSYANIVNLESNVSTANADVENMAYLTTPTMRGKLKLTQTFPASSNGQPVWYGKAEMNGYRAEASSQVPSTLTKGTSSDCHAIIFGDFSQLVFGEWGVLELIVDPFRLKKQGMIEVTSFQMGDCVVRQPAAFAAMKDARNV
jgi:HK97 family phage major capsid protein